MKKHFKHFERVQNIKFKDEKDNQRGGYSKEIYFFPILDEILKVK